MWANSRVWRVSFSQLYPMDKPLEDSSHRRKLRIRGLTRLNLQAHRKIWF